MSKELTPLQKLNNLYAILCHYSNKCGVGGAHTTEECGFNAFELKKDIESALKDYEETDNQLYDLFETFGINNRKDLLKKLKALEIIKKYANKDGVHIDFDRVMKATIKNFDYTTMTYVIDEKLLEEYDLLSEVLL